MFRSIVEMLINTDGKITSNDFLVDYDNTTVKLSYTNLNEVPSEIKYQFSLIEDFNKTHVGVSKSTVDGKPIYHIISELPKESKSFMEFVDILNTNNLIINVDWSSYYISSYFKVDTYHIEFSQLESYLRSCTEQRSINTMILDVPNNCFNSFIDYISPTYKKSDPNEFFLEATLFEMNRDRTHITSKLKTKSLVLRVFVTNRNFSSILAQVFNRFFKDPIEINISIYFCVVDPHVREVFDYAKVMKLFEPLSKHTTIDDIKVCDADNKVVFHENFNLANKIKQAYDKSMTQLKSTKILLNTYKQLDLVNNLQSEIVQLYTNGTLQTEDPRLDR